LRHDGVSGPLQSLSRPRVAVQDVTILSAPSCRLGWFSSGILLRMALWIWPSRPAVWALRLVGFTVFREQAEFDGCQISIEFRRL